MDEFGGNGPQKWTKQRSTTIEEAMEASMVEIVAKSHS